MKPIKHIDLWILKLSNNNVIKLESFKSIGTLDISSNYIKSIDFLSKNIKYLDLSINELENVEFLSNYTFISLNLTNNKIRDISSVNLANHKLKTIDLTMNKISLNSYLFGFDVGDDLETIYLDLDSIDSIKKLVNNRIVKHNQYYVFYKALFVIFSQQMEHVDCEFQLNYLKRNIVINLFYSFQIENFVLNCQNLLLN